MSLRTFFPILHRQKRTLYRQRICGQAPQQVQSDISQAGKDSQVILLNPTSPVADSWLAVRSKMSSNPPQVYPDIILFTSMAKVKLCLRIKYHRLSRPS